MIIIINRNVNKFGLIMKNVFLCVNHRVSLQNNPPQAFNRCQESLEMANLLSDEGKEKEAVPYYGSAFELAEILLTTGYLEIEDSVYLLVKVTSSFSKCLLAFGYEQESETFIGMTTNRIKRLEYYMPELHHCIQLHLGTLKTRNLIITCPESSDNNETASLLSVRLA